MFKLWIIIISINVEIAEGDGHDEVKRIPRGFWIIKKETNAINLGTMNAILSKYL